MSISGWMKPSSAARITEFSATRVPCMRCLGHRSCRICVGIAAAIWARCYNTGCVNCNNVAARRWYRCLTSGRFLSNGIHINWRRWCLSISEGIRRWCCCRGGRWFYNWTGDSWVQFNNCYPSCCLFHFIRRLWWRCLGRLTVVIEEKTTIINKFYCVNDGRCINMSQLLVKLVDRDLPFVEISLPDTWKHLISEQNRISWT